MTSSYFNSCHVNKNPPNFIYEIKTIGYDVLGVKFFPPAKIRGKTYILSATVTFVAEFNACDSNPRLSNGTCTDKRNSLNSCIVQGGLFSTMSKGFQIIAHIF